MNLSGVPAVFTHDDYQLGGGRLDVVTTVNTIEASLAQWTGAITHGLTDRIDVSLAVPVVRTTLSVLSNAVRSGSARRTQPSTSSTTIRPQADSATPQCPPAARLPASAISCCA